MDFVRLLPVSLSVFILGVLMFGVENGTDYFLLSAFFTFSLIIIFCIVSSALGVGVSDA